MGKSRLLLAAALVLALVPRVGAQESPLSPQPLPIVTALHVTGAIQLSERESLESMHVRVNEPLPDTPDRLAQAIERHYQDEGYTFARATVSFDDNSGLLTVTIDEGVIDAVEFQGVPAPVATRIAEDFALRAGDVFNRKRATQALRAALAPTRGAIAEGHVATAAADEDNVDRHRTFYMIDRSGQRVLLVGLRERDGRFRLEPDFGDREDWFTPVDGGVPSLGFGIVAFDHEQYNHTFIAGHLSIKTATGNVGYAIGFERPVFKTRKLYLGGEVRDLTGTDDTWQVSSTEASLDAIGVRKSFRDYYSRRGVQITGVWRVNPRIEFLAKWRGEHESPLRVESDFSFFNREDVFRPNRPALDGRLSAIVVGASLDSIGFESESLEATYRRHQLDGMFGERLPMPEKNQVDPIWRIDWTSEISTPGLSSDFDFRRHIVSARLRMGLGPFQDFAARAIGGWSEGSLPPQRQFAVGGMGSVHGYEFKQQVGDALALVNLEYAIGWRHGLRAVGFFDIGRASIRDLPSTPPGTPWLKGIGFGFAVADVIRIDFGYPVDGGVGPVQVLLRFGRTF
jgi:hypothetical protein